GLIGRAVGRLAAVDEADQAEDRVAIRDPPLQLLTDLQERQVEDGLVVCVIAALAQRLGGQEAITAQVAAGGADEDLPLAHGSQSLRGAAGLVPEGTRSASMGSVIRR